MMLVHAMYWTLDDKFIDFLIEKYQCVQVTEQQWFNCLKAMPSGVILYDPMTDSTIFQNQRVDELLKPIDDMINQQQVFDTQMKEKLSNLRA